MNVNCPNCKAVLNENEKFCHSCGTKVECNKEVFCSNCGKKLASGAKFCSECGATVGAGAPVQPVYQQPVYQPPVYQPPVYQPQAYQNMPYGGGVPPHPLLSQLSSRINIQGIMWLIVGGIQLLTALIVFIIGVNLASSRYTDEEGVFFIIYSIIIVFVAIYNIISGVGHIKYSKEVMVRPVGICDKYVLIGGYIGNLIFNILFGGVFGLACSIYGFVVRGFVMSHSMEFREIGKNYLEALSAQRRAAKSGGAPIFKD